MDRPLLDGILQVAITARDLDAATAFYRDTLGMKFLFTTGNMVFLETGTTRVLLGTENATGQSVLLYFRVADMDDAARRLAAAGITFAEEPRMIARLADRDVWLAAFRDPSGILHHVMSETPRAG